MSPKPLIIAHRGASNVAPENTLAALAQALVLGADGVEVDVRATADGVPVLLHDVTVDRTTDGSGDIASLTWAEVQRLDAGGWFDRPFIGEHIPSLKAALEWAGAHPTLLLFLEIKGRADQYPGLVEWLSGALEQEPSLAARTYVIAFEPWWISRLRELLRTAQTGLIYSRRPSDPIAAALALQANAIVPAWHTVNAADVRQAHVAGLAVYPWTVDAAEQVEAMWSLGVDGLITNQVALARQFLTDML